MSSYYQRKKDEFNDRRQLPVTPYLATLYGIAMCDKRVEEFLQDLEPMVVAYNRLMDLIEERD